MANKLQHPICPYPRHSTSPFGNFVCFPEKNRPTKVAWSTVSGRIWTSLSNASYNSSVVRETASPSTTSSFSRVLLAETPQQYIVPDFFSPPYSSHTYGQEGQLGSNNPKSSKP